MDTLDCDHVEGFSAACGFAPIAPLFFICFIIIAAYMVLSLVVAVILDKFVDAAQAEAGAYTRPLFSSN